MPEKDGSEDKKSTKSVVNKKQKQFMNQEEQLDLSSVAESFGGQIVGEPVELDEGLGSIVTGLTKTGKYFKKPAARKTFMQFLDLLPPSAKKAVAGIPATAKRQLNKLRPKIRKLNRQLDQSKGFDKIGDVEKGNVTSFVPDTPIKKPFKPLKPLKDFIRTGTEKAKTQFQKIKDTLKKNKKKDTSYDLSKDYNVSGNKNKSKIGTTTKVAGGVGLTGLGVGTLIGTQLKKPGGGKFRLGGLPGTAHNVGRRTNPQ